MTTKSSIPSLADMLSKHPIELLPSNKILCKVTQHEMPARADVVYAHLNGKRFKKEVEWYSYNFDEFLPYIVPHKENKFMSCLLTDEKLNKIPEQIKKHMNGKRFQRLKAEHEAREAKKAAKQNKKANGSNNNNDDDSEEEDSEGDDEEEELEIPDNIAGAMGIKTSDKKRKTSTNDSNSKPNKANKTAINEEEADGNDSEDNLSDLMGSDFEDDEDNESEIEEEAPQKKAKSAQSSSNKKESSSSSGSKSKQQSNSHSDKNKSQKVKSNNKINPKNKKQKK